MPIRKVEGIRRELRLTSVWSHDCDPLEDLRHLTAMRTRVGPHCTPEISWNRQGEFGTGEASVSGERGEFRHGEPRVGVDRSRTCVDRDTSTSVQQDNSSNPGVTHDDVAPTSENPERPPLALCKANHPAECESIPHRDEKVRRSANAHRRVFSKERVALCT